MPVKAKPGQINGDAFDFFTAVHAAAGVAMRAVGAPLWTATAAAVVWEVIENPLKDRFTHLFPHPSHDTKMNAAVDALAMIGAWKATDWFLNRGQQ